MTYDSLKMTRILTLSVLAFWVVMTVLLLRMVYFPDQSRYVEVPARRIMKSFLEGGTTINTLHIYHKDKKLGNASVNARRIPDKEERYRVHLSGSLDKGALESVEGQVSWRLEVDVINMEQWGGARGQVRLIDTGMVLDFEWPKDQRMPTFTLKQKDMVVADDESIRPLVASLMGQGATGGLGLPGGMGATPEADIAALIRMKAMEGMMMLAGQNRHAYLMEFSAMDQWKARAFFTDAGELALVDLPEGYRLVEPVIYGLVPEYNEDDEVPVEPLPGEAPIPAASPQIEVGSKSS